MSHSDTASGLMALQAAVAGLPDGRSVPFPEEASASTPPGSFLALLGMVPLRVGRWFAEARMPITATHRDPNGQVSPAAVAAFADAVAGWATFAVLGAEIGFTTAVLVASPADTGVIGSASVVHGRAELLGEGRRAAVLGVDVRAAGPEGDLVSRTVCTQILLADRLEDRRASSSPA